jgi:hypothetical protein
MNAQYALFYFLLTEDAPLVAQGTRRALLL